MHLVNKFLSSCFNSSHSAKAKNTANRRGYHAFFVRTNDADRYLASCRRNYARSSSSWHLENSYFTAGSSLRQTTAMILSSPHWR